MGTTVWVDPTTRDRLQRRKRRTGAPSIDAVIRELLAESEPNAKKLFAIRRAAVRRVCRDHGITKLIAFGSRARGEAGESSDLDLAFDVDAPRLETFDLFDHMALKDALAEAFGIPVDVVRLGAAPARLTKRIERDGVVLVGSP